MIRRREMMGKKKEILPQLPDGYTAIKYCTNMANAYIDTGIALTKDYSVECEVSMLSYINTHDTNLSFIFGAFSTVNTANRNCKMGIYAMYFNNSGGVQGFCGCDFFQAKTQKYSLYASGINGINSKCYIKLTPTKGIIKTPEKTVEQDLYNQYEFNNQYYGVQGDYKLILFNVYSKKYGWGSSSYDWKVGADAVGQENYHQFLGRIYYLNVWNGDTQVRAMVPAIRDADGKIGMFDTINNVFYEPQNGDLTMD